MRKPDSGNSRMSGRNPGDAPQTNDSVARDLPTMGEWTGNVSGGLDDNGAILSFGSRSASSVDEG